MQLGMQLKREYLNEEKNFAAFMVFEPLVLWHSSVGWPIAKACNAKDE